MVLSNVTAHYAQRLAEADPLLPIPAYPHPGDGEVLLTAHAGDSTATGISRYYEPDVHSLAATWGALHRHSLEVQLAGPDPASALDVLLGQWDRRIAEHAAAGDVETSATINWPSRQTAGVATLVAHGFAPLRVAAAREAGRAAAPAPVDPAIEVRPLRADELDLAAELNMVVVRYDARFGTVIERPSTAAALRDYLAGSIADDRATGWLGLRAGEPLGLLYLDLPPRSDWAATMVRAPSVGYLACLSVRDGARGSGIGGALVAEAHRVLDEAGIAVTVLHHALPNPRSTPFWYSRGYRPVWTGWTRRPAVPARLS